MASGIRKVAEIRADDFENDEDHLRELEPLVRQIEADMPDERLDARAIARFQTGILQFMENALGPNSMPPRPFPKLPYVYIDDHSPHGPLYDIIMKFFQLKEAKGLKTLEWRNPQQRMVLMDILGTVRSTLAKNGYAVSPVVLLDAAVTPVDVEELTAMVESMKGRVVKERNAVGLTHIVYPFGPDGDPDDGQEYMRVQRKRASKALVHRWYAPDSHNEWLEASVAPETVENDVEHVLNGPAKVFVRWLRDSKKYNEWMNVVDYETDEGNEEHERYKGDLSRRGLTPAMLLSNKRKALRQAAGPGGANKVRIAEASLLEVDPNFREEVSDGVTRRHVLVPSKKLKEGTLASENLSFGQMPKLHDGSDVHLALARLRSPPPPAPVGAGRAPGPAPPAGATPLEAAAVEWEMPAYAQWWRPDAVHDIERNANVEFFNGASDVKTEAVYKEYRDFMIREYRRTPKKKLTFLECRRMLVGDVNSIYRVWSFLDNWGLINFEAAPRRNLDETLEVITVDASGKQTARPMKRIGPVATTFVAPSATNLLQLPKVTAAGGVSAAVDTPAEARAARAGAGLDGASMARRDTLGRSIPSASGGKASFFCNVMPWVDCSACRYHCTKYPDIDLCPQAFAEGRLPPGTSAKDFVRVDASVGRRDSETGWSEQESLLLLEAVELHGDAWDKVAEHVASKSKLDCLLHFLQMPIEDEFVADLESGGLENGGAVPSNAKIDSATLFAAEPNPLTAQLAFIAEIVGPKVAAAAASAALQELLSSGSPSQHTTLQAAADAAQLPTDPAAAADPAGGGGIGEAAEMGVQDLKAAVPAVKLRAAAGAALAGASIKAKFLAEGEELRMSALAMDAIEALTEKLTMKLRYLQDIEGEMRSAHVRLVEEREGALREREALKAQRLQLQQQQQMMAHFMQGPQGQASLNSEAQGGLGRKDSNTSPLRHPTTVPGGEGGGEGATPVAVPGPIPTQGAAAAPTVTPATALPDPVPNAAAPATTPAATSSAVTHPVATSHAPHVATSSAARGPTHDSAAPSTVAPVVAPSAAHQEQEPQAHTQAAPPSASLQPPSVNVAQVPAIDVDAPPVATQLDPDAMDTSEPGRAVIHQAAAQHASLTTPVATTTASAAQAILGGEGAAAAGPTSPSNAS